MYITYNSDTYPFDGVFFRFTIDKSKPLLEQKEERIDILTTPCDITEGGLNKNPKFVSASYSVFFPFEEDKEIPVRLGDMFEGSIYGIQVNGRVIGLFPSQLMGCVAYIDDKDV